MDSCRLGVALFAVLGRDTLCLVTFMPWGICTYPPPHQIKVEFSMKFTSRDMSLKRTPSKKQTGVFGVKISVVTK